MIELELRRLEQDLEQRAMDVAERSKGPERESLTKDVRLFVETVQSTTQPAATAAELQWRQRALEYWREFLRAEELRAAGLLQTIPKRERTEDSSFPSQGPRWLEAVKQASQRQRGIGEGFVGLANQATDLARREARAWIDLYLDELRWYADRLRR